MTKWIIILGILLILVLWNSNRSVKGQRKRNRKNFRKSYYERKKERENKS